ncbi:Oxoglutarate and iron-dependent oxygenase degradation C-term-domain-containing protein [Neurospora hispaniola]|uniref:uS12 prolyl 3,4-dihydroxylase n=1 Tax=Neurospora hispaniola TaxID=588809 RepID=A0AAJ0IDE2_9PEZI|nr:Oxoglutarate and iron-dependent oxygenase degradation C-term-domain-containing protein [Neurospora hispaniola]
MVKRKAENQARSDSKKSAKNLKKSKNTLSPEDTKARFRKGLFDKSVLNEYTQEYASSTPYKHAVINELVDDSLLRKVRDEIKDNVSFTPKETDIYKIHQSGDLANLDGLDDDALSKLPSLLALRDALYSETFRNYVSHITDCGPLSGRKTDMAINVYTPGCYLLCHDDVIGSRKVSYILYLTDPDTPWKPEWGGALRLFPVEDREGKDGEIAKTPLPDPVKVIPPAWNQLSFFAVQPGESFHDVEEVYHASKEELEKQGGRIRMAISGWFHIPQIGEDGYVEGAEEKAAHKSGLMQLQGNPDQYDRPIAKPVQVEKESSNEDEENTFDEADLEFLLKYLAPTYLTPDTIENIADHFEEQFSITLSDILHPKFAAKIKEYVEAQEAKKLPEGSEEIEKSGAWKVARPPHKHRFLYLQPGEENAPDSPIKELLDVLLPSRQFRLWLQMATRSTIEGHDLLARRFRHGKDYTLATGHDGKARLELNIGLTPTDGWGDVEEEDEDEEEEEESDEEEAKGKGKGKGKATSNGSSKDKGKGKAVEKNEKAEEETVEVGGHEVYMAGDDDEDEDAAIYKSSEDDDNILFFQAAAWNKMTLVLRDSGTLRFVKYVSRAAKGDRWDVSGSYEIEEQDEDPDAEELAAGAEDDEAGSEDDEFNGFSDGPDGTGSD